MICIDYDRKSVMLGNPKTGSRTCRRQFLKHFIDNEAYLDQFFLANPVHMAHFHEPGFITRDENYEKKFVNTHDYVEKDGKKIIIRPGHISIRRYMELYHSPGEPDISKFKSYSFVRDPIDYFVSQYRLCVLNLYRYVAAMHDMDIQLENARKLAKANNNTSIELELKKEAAVINSMKSCYNIESKEDVDAITPARFIELSNENQSKDPGYVINEEGVKLVPAYSILLNVRQSKTLQEDTELFDFANYEENLRKILKIFGTTLDMSDPFPRIGRINPEDQPYPDLTKNEREMIAEFYSGDYDFFSERGIHYKV